MTSKVRKIVSSCDTALLIIGGVNSKGEKDHWNLRDAGYTGDLYPIAWKSDFKHPENVRDALNPSKVVETATSYLQVVQEADEEGGRLAREFRHHPMSNKRVFVLAHSMGTRLAAAFLRELAETDADSAQLQQVFLFNGAAPIHPGSDFREWALDHVPSGVHNFFNPMDPVIAILAVLCRVIQFLPLSKLPLLVAEFARSTLVGNRFAPPIGHFPTTTVSYNYNTMDIQGPNHGVGDLARYLRFDTIRERFDILCPLSQAISSTISEALVDLKKAFTEDPFVRAEDYLRPLSKEGRKIVEDICSGGGGANEVINATFELLRCIGESGDKHAMLMARMKELAKALEHPPCPRSPLLPDKPIRYLPA